MSLQVLFRAKAFGPGSDLWLVPDPDKSADVRKMDWYLNFQLAKARTQKNQEMAPELKNILIQNEWPELRPGNKDQQALMIAANPFLPTQMVVMVPSQKQFSQWVAQAKKVWAGLGRPSVRIFLPEGESPDTMKELWPSSDQLDQITIVPA